MTADGLDKITFSRTKKKTGHQADKRAKGGVMFEEKQRRGPIERIAMKRMKEVNEKRQK